MDWAAGVTTRRFAGGAIPTRFRRSAVAAIIVMAAIGAWAVLTGQLSYVVTYGVSMNPVYYKGDLVLIWREDSYQVGQIVAYHGTQPGQKVLHRIIGGDATSGFVFKGDNNKSIDPVEPKADHLIGHAFLHIPKAGKWLQPLLSPTGLGMIGFMVAGGAAAAPRNRREIPRGRRKKKVKAMSRQGGPLTVLAAVARTVSRLPPILRVAAVLSATLAVFGLTLGVLGWMKPVTVTRPATGGQSIAFAYSTTVPRSAAYDGTQVNGPEPIFRRLAQHVGVRVRYSGHPGTLAITTRLQATNGWHTTLPAPPPTRFLAASTQSVFDLDLTALDRRVNAGAKAIGIDPGAVTILIQAGVTSPSAAGYSASFQLGLTPLMLTFASGSLNNQSPTAPQILNRGVGLPGHPVMTASKARTTAVLLLLLALSGGVIVTLFARRSATVRTRAEIERRYPQLLVHVEPMASPPGKPVVNVDNFPALVKLAERYGQMILTWRRPEADDFVVRDEGITYRYRVALDEPTLQNVELIDRPPGAGTHRRRAASEVS
jgi:signal peptidase I